MTNGMRIHLSISIGGNVRRTSATSSEDDLEAVLDLADTLTDDIDNRLISIH